MLAIEITTSLDNSIEFNLCDKIRNALAKDPSTAHIAPLAGIKVCDLAAGNSILLYVLCDTVDSLLRLRELYDKSQLRVILINWFRKLFDSNRYILHTLVKEGSCQTSDSIKESFIVAIYLVDYYKCLRFFGIISHLVEISYVTTLFFGRGDCV